MPNRKLCQNCFSNTKQALASRMKLALIFLIVVERLLGMAVGTDIIIFVLIVLLGLWLIVISNSNLTRFIVLIFIVILWVFNHISKQFDLVLNDVCGENEKSKE